MQAGRDRSAECGAVTSDNFDDAKGRATPARTKRAVYARRGREPWRRPSLADIKRKLNPCNTKMKEKSFLKNLFGIARFF